VIPFVVVTLTTNGFPATPLLVYGVRVTGIVVDFINDDTSQKLDGANTGGEREFTPQLATT
jgi:hypothetical protein